MSRLALLLFVLSLSGCASRGAAPLTYNTLSASVPGMQTVENAGTFSLYASDRQLPMTSKQLEPGDQYGFMRDRAGNVVAAVVTNGERQVIELTAGHSSQYSWKQTATSSP